MFKKVGLLGEGSFGVVHRAMSPSGAWFAVKSSPFDMSSSLQKERRIYAALRNCPEIIQCFCNYLTVEEKGSRRYNLVLEYASGGSLSHLMSQYPGGRLPETEVKEFTRMLLRGLSFIHRFGYVHCDLKPDNVMVFLTMGLDGSVVKQVKLADFGLAKEPNKGENRSPGEFRGTPWYMSPESVLYGQVDAKLDIWSLGCVVIEMVTGRPVYDSITDKYDLKWKLGILKEAPAIPENMSVFGKDFLTRCFDVDPDRRWSADELLGHPFVAETWTPRFPSRPCTLGFGHRIIYQNMTSNVCVL